MEGYYLDKDLYKKCYYTCKKCVIEGNNLIHNCIECIDNFSFGIKNNEYFNCYENCSYYHYFDNENNFHCTLNSSCPKEYSYLIENTLECIKYNNNIIETTMNILNIVFYETEKIKEEEIKYYDNILKNIDEGFTSLNFDTLNIDNGEDEIIKTEKLIITLTTTQNQRNNININID